MQDGNGIDSMKTEKLDLDGNIVETVEETREWQPATEEGPSVAPVGTMPSEDMHSDGQKPYWYQRLGRSIGGTIAASVGALVVVALVSGFSAFGGAQAALSHDGLDGGRGDIRMERSIDDMRDDGIRGGMMPGMDRDGSSDEDSPGGRSMDERSADRMDRRGSDDGSRGDRSDRTENADDAGSTDAKNGKSEASEASVSV